MKSELFEEEFDTHEEVQAVFNVQRRISLTYGVVFLFFTLAAAIAALFVPWWHKRLFLGGLTLNFLAAGFLLYLFYFFLVWGYSRAANRLEDQMLGGRELQDDDWLT